MQLKSSVGIWGFGNLKTRFLAAGYHPEYEHETMEARTERVVRGLGDLLDGFEYHYPNEVDEGNVDRIRAILGPDHDIYCIASGAHTFSKHARGAFTNPDPKVRADAIATAKAAVDLAGAIGAHFIIWPGIEGYNYPFQCDYRAAWSWFLDAVGQITEQAARQRVTVLLEHKNSEPAMKIHMRDVGMTLYVIHKLRERGTPTDNLKINLDWQHLIMNGEHLAEYAALLAGDGLLGHLHANSGWGLFDDDNMVGATSFMETLELARTLQEVGYGQHGERVGYDLFPYTEDAIAATRQSVLHWQFIWDLAARIDGAALEEARRAKDAVRAYQAVYAALGLDLASAKRPLA